MLLRQTLSLSAVIKILNDCYIEQELNIYLKPFEVVSLEVVSLELFLIFLGLLNECLVKAIVLIITFL